MRTSALSASAYLPATHGNVGVAPSSRIYLTSANAQQESRTAVPHLTPRQLEVLALLCQGLPNKLICRRLNISPGTVKAHISSILRELGVASRLQAVVEASRRGLVDANEPCAAEPRSTAHEHAAASVAIFADRAVAGRSSHGQRGE